MYFNPRQYSLFSVDRGCIGDLHLAQELKNIIIEALDLYVSRNIDFIDAYNAVVMHEMNLTQLYTDTKHFKRIDGIEVLQP